MKFTYIIVKEHMRRTDSAEAPSELEETNEDLDEQVRRQSAILSIFYLQVAAWNQIQRKKSASK